jgi:hypothetical protein
MSQLKPRYSIQVIIMEDHLTIVTNFSLRFANSLIPSQTPSNVLPSCAEKKRGDAMLGLPSMQNFKTSSSKNARSG